MTFDLSYVTHMLRKIMAAELLIQFSAVLTQVTGEYYYKYSRSNTMKCMSLLVVQLPVYTAHAVVSTKILSVR